MNNAFVSKAESHHKDVKKSDLSKYNAPNIVRYTDLAVNSNGGYAYIYIFNGEESHNYEESVTFTKFTGCELMPPFDGQSATVTLAPGESKMIMIKTKAMWSLSYKMGMRIY